jgi:hypothetical protein
MNSTEVLTLLAYCNELDGRHAPNEVKVRAWVDVFNQGAPDMPVAFARDVAKRHYAHIDDMITPSTFIRMWANHKKTREIAQNVNSSDAHCKRHDCRCTHTSPCYRGWLDNDEGTAVPCRVCRSSLADVLDRIPPRGMRQEHDFALIRNRFSLGEGTS